MVGLGRSGYYDGLAAVVMVLRWLDCGGEGATMAGLQWRECYVGLSERAGHVMAEEGLCVGDSVCLYSEDVSGYLYSFQSSSIHSELAVVPRQSRNKPQVPYSQATRHPIPISDMSHTGIGRIPIRDVT
ncbi:hypothetical protein LSAT2_003981 [Lamellibrachia satsuma]|nr:hypothetical protein LSAT2_003981 [Lamellibrachia satsuma]